MRTIALALVLLTPIACGPAAAREAAPEATTAPPRSIPARHSEALVQAHPLPEQAYALGAERLELLVQAAFAANPEAPPRTGRIEIEGGTVRYAQAPSDHLEVVFGGRTHRFEVHEASGVGGAEDFFERDHRLRVSSAIDGGAPLELSSTRTGARREASVRGAAPLGPRTCGVELTWVGTETFESDRTGAHHTLDTAVAGIARCPGAFTLEVSEGWAFELVSATGAYAAQTAERSVGGALVVEGTRYAFMNLQTRAAFRDGKPTELDAYWHAAGAVLRDGQPWGALALEPGVVTEDGGFVQFVLQTPEAPLVIESYQVY